MKHLVLIPLLALGAAALAQTAPKPATTHSATAAHPVAHPAAASTAIKLPPGVPPMSGPLATAFALRYQEIKVGTGAEGEAGKLWHIKYTGWRAADGVKFDSWDDHRQPLLDKDGKPQMGPDGKPVLGEPQPLGFPQGMGHVIPGFDFGLTGMRIGGKRRLFIPWQMAYGVHNLPDRPDHPGIPPKSDLIFDVELVDVTELPAMPTGMPGGMPHPVPQPGGSGNAAPPPSSTQPSAPPQSQQSAPPQSQPK